jgi:hypothetical protein
MKKKRDIFTELTEGFDALKSQREGKPTSPLTATSNAQSKARKKPAPSPTPKRLY